MSRFDDEDLAEYNSWFNSPQDEINFLASDEFHNDVTLAPEDVEQFTNFNSEFDQPLNNYQEWPEHTPGSSDSGNYSPGSSNDDITCHETEYTNVFNKNEFFSNQYEYESPVQEVYTTSQMDVGYSSPLKADIAQRSPPLINSHVHIPLQQSLRPPPIVQQVQQPQQLQQNIQHVEVVPHLKMEASPSPQATTTAIPIILSRPVFLQAVPCTSQVLVNPVTTMTKPQMVNLSSGINVVNNVASTHSGQSSGDDHEKRIEDKKMRNRASAQASRQRKKVEVETLKQQLDEYQSECVKLRQENENLRKRVLELEEERLRISPTPHKRVKKAAGVCLAVCALFFSFSSTMPPSLTSSSTELQLATSKDLIYIKEHHGRSLARYEYEEPPTTKSNLTLCHPLNTTENAKLSKDLTKWIQRHEQLNLVELRKGVDPFLIYNSPTALQLKNLTKTEIKAPVNTLNQERKRSLRKRKLAQNYFEVKNDTFIDSLGLNYNGTINVTETKVQLMDKLSKSIKREDDVLYLVVMQNYFLLPTITRNGTQLPKISIIIPALTNNVSSPKMMSIDCQVVGTELLKLSRDVMDVLSQNKN